MTRLKMLIFKYSTEYKTEEADFLTMLLISAILRDLHQKNRYFITNSLQTRTLICTTSVSNSLKYDLSCSC